MLKDISAQLLRERLHEVVHGEMPMSETIATKVLAEFNRQGGGEAGGLFEPLTEREV
jgi:DNA-binding NarL/FixJ family response regulator